MFIKKMNRKKMVICLLSISLSILLLLTLVGCSSQSDNQISSGKNNKKVYLTIPSATMGGTYYTYTAGVAQVINKYLDGVEVTVNSSAGSLENAKLLDSGEAKFSPMAMPIAKYAFEGKESFSNPIPLQGAFIMFTSKYHIFTLDQNVKSIGDLRGKRISVGVGGSLMEKMGKLVLDSYGILDDVKLSYYSPAETITAIKDGNVDAGMILISPPWTGLTELATRNNVKLVPVETDLQQKIKSNFAVGYSKIPGGTYPGIEEDVPVLTTYEAMFAHKDTDEKLVYDFVKAIFEHKNELEEIHSSGKETVPELILEGMAIPLHPGALKYYEEINLKIPSEMK